MPWFDELSRRNPFPNAIDLIDLVVGVWSLCGLQFVSRHISRDGIMSSRIKLSSQWLLRNMARYAPGNLPC
jgi:hypothetical protein